METDRPPSRQGDASDSGGGNIVKAWPPASLALDNPDGKELKSQNLSSLLLITCHLQGGHGTGKTGNLVLTFSRQGKHREFCFDTGKNFETQGKYFSVTQGKI